MTYKELFAVTDLLNDIREGLIKVYRVNPNIVRVDIKTAKAGKLKLIIILG